MEYEDRNPFTSRRAASSTEMIVVLYLLH